jgi:hypothetical protein
MPVTTAACGAALASAGLVADRRGSEVEPEDTYRRFLVE